MDGALDAPLEGLLGRGAARRRAVRGVPGVAGPLIHTVAGAGGDWRLLHAWAGAPGLQMARDEALLSSVETRPTLRFYTFEPDTLSLGYFQRWTDVPERARASAVVRRLTGGGAIHHAHELTFALAAALDHPLYRGPIAASYARVHGLLAHALAGLGVDARLRGELLLRSERPRSAMCFHVSSALDLVWDGAKGVGSAQRRSGGRVLHHGSIKLGTTPLEGEVATLWEHAPALTPAELALRVIAAFEELLGVRFAREQESPAEAAHAHERAAFFASPAHLERR